MNSQLLRFIAVGGLNTLLGFSIIVFLSRVVGVHDVIANVCGFAVGACCSYLLNKTFTFESRKRHRQAAPMFVLLIGLCMAANLAVLMFARHRLQLPSLPAQAIAVLTYNVLFFVGSKLVVFRD